MQFWFQRLCKTAFAWIQKQSGTTLTTCQIYVCTSFLINNVWHYKLIEILSISFQKGKIDHLVYKAGYEMELEWAHMTSEEVLNKLGLFSR